MWPEHNGIRRAILEEGQRHFVSEESAREWLKKQVAYGDTLYTDRGLVIQWCKSYPQSSSPKSSHGVLHARVWQIYIHGKRPEYRDGYADDIIVRYPDDYPFFEVIPPSKEIDHWSAQ
jgi:mannosyltransferase OCH1-like enzyme